MRHPNKHFFLIFVSCMLFLASGYADVPSILPEQEKNSIENIELPAFIPKVSLHSASHDFSLLDTYLNSHGVTISLSADQIAWEVIIPSKASSPMLIGDGSVSVKDELTPTLSEENLVYSMESEIVKNVLFSKNFLLDVISSLQKQKDYQEIHSIFYPGKRISTEILQTRLNNSLEFKVLSHQRNSCSSNKLAQNISDQKYQINLCDSILQKQKELLTPYVSLQEIFLTPLTNTELAKNIAPTPPTIEKQATTDIEVSGLGLPVIIARNNIGYIYHPNMNWENLAILAAQPSKWEIKGIKRFFAPLKDEFYIAKVGRQNLILQEESAPYVPEVASIETNYLKIKTYAKAKKDLIPLSSANLEEINSPQKKSLIALSSNKLEKHLFIDSNFDLPYGKKFYPVDDVKISKSKTAKNHFPGKEPLFIEKEVLLSLFLAGNDKKYLLNTDQIINPAATYLVSKTSYSPYNGNCLEENKCLKQISVLFDDYKIPLNNIPKPTFIEYKRIAKYETIEERLDTDYPSLEVKEKTMHSFLRDSYPLTYDKKIAFKEGLIGRLRSGPIKNSEVLFTDDQLDYFSLLTPMQFAENIKDSDSSREEKFVLKSEAFSLNDEQFTKAGVHTGISKIDSHSFHPFSVPIKKVSYKNTITKATISLSSVKEIIDIDPSIDFSSQEVVLDEKNYLVSNFSPDNVLPLKTEETHLERQVGLAKAEFSTSIALPKLMAINNKSSFFLNPMLLLINSNSYDIHGDMTDTAYKTNRANRMTQYSLFNWPTLEELQTDSLPEAFTLETRLLTKNDSSKGEFACTIKSFEKNVLEPLPIHLLYILDTSTSIEPHRFKIFKDAIVKSIDYLEPDAKFNIAILSRGKVEMLQENGVLSTASSKSFAKRYLRKIEQSDNIFFEDLVSLVESEKKLASLDITHRMCVLLSDGKFANNIRVDREGLKYVSDIKTGNFSLYTASVSDKNNKPMLSFLSKLNHGFSLYTRTHASFPRKFSTLVKHLQHPIMHDITISFPDETDSKVYLADHLSPILLADKGLTFYGKNESQTSSRVFIQGKAGDRWINILKELPLNTARKGRYTFQKNLASQKTFLSLYSFLRTKDEKHIINAKEHVSDYDLTLPIP